MKLTQKLYDDLSSEIDNSLTIKAIKTIYKIDNYIVKNNLEIEELPNCIFKNIDSIPAHILVLQYNDCIELFGLNRSRIDNIVFMNNFHKLYTKIIINEDVYITLQNATNYLDKHSLRKVYNEIENNEIIIYIEKLFA